MVEDISLVREQEKNAKTIEEKERLAYQRCRLNLIIKKSARHAKRIWKEDLVRQAQLAAERKDPRKLYRLTRLIANRNLPTKHPVKDKAGMFLSPWTNKYCVGMNTSQIHSVAT